MRHYAQGTPQQIDYPPVSLVGLLEETAAKHPQHDAVKLILRAPDGETYRATLTYAGLMAEVNRFAAALTALGVQPGDRVGLMLPNLPQFVIAFYGALKAGAVVVNTNPTYTPRELEHQYRDAGVETVILLSPYVTRLDSAPVRRAVKRVIVTELTDYLPEELRARAEDAYRGEGLIGEVPAAAGVHRFRDLLGDAPAAPAGAP